MQGRRPQTVTRWWQYWLKKPLIFTSRSLHRLVKDWRAARSTAKWNHWKCGKTGAKKWNICLRSSGTLLALETSGDFPTYASEAVEVGANDAAFFWVCFFVCRVCLKETRFVHLSVSRCFTFGNIIPGIHYLLASSSSEDRDRFFAVCWSVHIEDITASGAQAWCNQFPML